MFTPTRHPRILAAIGLGGALALWGASQEFWDQKDPKDWTQDQVQEMLTLSPWAKAAKISFFNLGPGGEGAGIAGREGAGLGSQRIGGGQSAKANGRGDNKTTNQASNPGTFRATVRWESSQPVRAAAKTRPSDGDSQFYILSLNGDIPDFARPNDEESPEARQQRVMMLRQSTKLERKGGSTIYLERIEPGPSGTLFYFSRLDPITPANKEITFTAKMGPLEIKAKFVVKEMMYKGKLEL